MTGFHGSFATNSDDIMCHAHLIVLTVLTSHVWDHLTPRDARIERAISRAALDRGATGHTARLIGVGSVHPPAQAMSMGITDVNDARSMIESSRSQEPVFYRRRVCASGGLCPSSTPLVQQKTCQRGGRHKRSAKLKERVDLATPTRRARDVGAPCGPTTRGQPSAPSRATASRLRNGTRAHDEADAARRMAAPLRGSMLRGCRSPL